MLKICLLFQRFLMLCVASILFGCSTMPQSNIDVSMLKPYQKLMLVPIKTDEMLFVTQRNQNILAGNSGSLFSLLDDLRMTRDQQMNQDFNKQIKRDMKPELEAQLYDAINKNFIANQIKYTIFEASSKDISSNRHSNEQIKNYAKLLRQKCITCDAALIVDPSFGFVQKGNAGWRAASNADLMLLNLVDGKILAKSSASFVDETEKYDFPADVDVLKTTPGAEQYVVPTVDGLAKVMLGSTGLKPR